MRSFFEAIWIACLLLFSRAYGQTYVQVAYAQTDHVQNVYARTAYVQTACSQTAYVQTGNNNPRTITLRATAISLIDAFDSIHLQQPSIKFNYCPGDIAYIIHLNLHNVPIDLAMDSCLSGLPLDYTRDDYRGRTSVTYITIRRRLLEPALPAKDTIAILSAMRLRNRKESDGARQDSN